MKICISAGQCMASGTILCLVAMHIYRYKLVVLSCMSKYVAYLNMYLSAHTFIVCRT